MSKIDTIIEGKVKKRLQKKGKPDDNQEEEDVDKIIDKMIKNIQPLTRQLSIVKIDLCK